MLTPEQKIAAIDRMLNDDDYRDFVRDCGTDDLADSILSILHDQPNSFAQDFVNAPST